MAKKDGLQSQISLFSMETKDFYTNEEKVHGDRCSKLLFLKNKIKRKKDATTEKEKLEEIKSWNLRLNKLLKKEKESLELLLATNSSIRTLREDSVYKTNKDGSKETYDNKKISLFESSLTRTCGFKKDECIEDLFVVRVYHYAILNSIIKNGFLYNGEKYIYFTSSAGQIRTKKIVCIKESVFKKHENTITCGLTKETINKKGGVNTNKYQAYLALISSASEKWLKFNVSRMVVVDDIEVNVNAEVDYIDRDTYEIERKTMDLPIEHMDGCGIMLPTVSKKSFMFRMPWMKGLLTPFDFKKFALEHNKTKIIDIYGKEFDIIEDDINIILTKSQFKMWKYYSSWEEYQNKFTEYKCEANKLNIEDVGADATINYQMLQTLTNITESELIELASDSVEDIRRLGDDKSTMLRVLGATKENKNKTGLQKSLLLYPELLTDSNSRETIKNKKRKLIRDAKSGKLRVNGKYTFIIPDVYAFCEWLFLGDKNPQGLLRNKEVHCNIFEEGKLDVLRAPHLYKEHAVRNNIYNSVISEWFITKGIYISMHDPISKVLQCDFDGDKALVIQDETLVKVAEREMNGIVPLYYEMAKAEDSQITSEKMYEALTSAYKANIGIISNDITKIWNSETPNINAVKWLTMYNNFVIDYAKTLFLPKPPEEAENIIKSFTKSKVPHFFIYAKDKEERLVESVNNSTVNKLNYLIEERPIRFKNVAGEVNYKMLMNNKKVNVSQAVIDKFIELKRSERFWLSRNESSSSYHFDKMMREELGKISKKETYIVDTLVKYLYSTNSGLKDGLWNAYGDVLYENLAKNLKGTIQCELCPERFETLKDNEKYCEECKAKAKKERNRVADLKYKQKKREKL